MCNSLHDSVLSTADVCILVHGLVSLTTSASDGCEMVITVICYFLNRNFILSDSEQEQSDRAIWLCFSFFLWLSHDM